RAAPIPLWPRRPRLPTRSSPVTSWSHPPLLSGLLSSLTTQELVSLVLYHILPRYYTLFTFETTSNPMNTQASRSSSIYTLNITT
ncbi:Fasciclin domain, partial [Musa troglodytarum]